MGVKIVLLFGLLRWFIDFFFTMTLGSQRTLRTNNQCRNELDYAKNVRQNNHQLCRSSASERRSRAGTWRDDDICACIGVAVIHLQDLLTNRDEARHC